MSPVSGGEPLHPMAAFGPTDDPRRWGTDQVEAPIILEADQDTLPQPRHSGPTRNWSTRAGDGFAWLYRWDTATSRSKRRPADTSAAAGCASLVSSSYPPVPVPPPSAPRSRNPMILMIVILLCLTAGAVTGIACCANQLRTAGPGSGSPV